MRCASARSSAKHAAIQRSSSLSSTVEADNFLFSADLANLDVSFEGNVVKPRGTLHLLRSRFLWRDVCYEQFLFVNHGLSELLVPFRINFDADFADIFEVRGEKRLKRGEMLINRSGRLVAKVRILSVETNRCVANILPDWKQGEPMEGDVAIVGL